VLRQWLASLLPPCPARDDVVIVASELGCNAIRHTRSGQGGRFTVEVTWSAAVVRVAVADGGAATGPTVIDDPGSEHGRGLVVVRELSVRMGACGDRLGRLVWADVPWDGTAAAAVAASPAGQDAAIRNAEAALARRFADVPVWFGRATCAWRALAAEVAAAFLVHPRTIIRWADTGKLPRFRTPGGHRRFLAAEVGALLAAAAPVGHPASPPPASPARGRRPGADSPTRRRGSQ